MGHEILSPMLPGTLVSADLQEDLMETQTDLGTRAWTQALDMALDDIVGLVEAYRACTSSDNNIADPALAAIRRELGAAADAYAAVVLASAGGNVSQDRIERAREEAAVVMPLAWRRQKELAKRVEATRARQGSSP